MAQLLVFQRDNTHPDPVTDRRGCYKTGDVVVVMEDDHVFGAAETQHPFAVVSVPGPASQWRYLTEGEPETIRDRYPRSMHMIKRLQIPMLKTLRGETRRRRKYTADNLGNTQLKQTGGA